MWSQVTQAGEGKSTFARCLAGQARWCGCSCVFDLAHMQCRLPCVIAPKLSTLSSPLFAGAPVRRLFLHRSLLVRLSATLCQCACPPLFASAPVRRLPVRPVVLSPFSCSFSQVICVHLLDPPPKGVASASEVRGPALASARSRDSFITWCGRLLHAHLRRVSERLQRPGAPDCMSVHAVCACATSMMQASR